MPPARLRKLHRMRRVLFLTSILLLSLHAPARAEDAGVETHDGLFVRLTLGFGTGDTTMDVPASAGLALSDTELSFSGVSGFFSVDVGGALAKNLVLHGRIGDFLAFGPTVTIDGQDVGDTNGDASVGWVMIAPALTYYFMPVNVYLTLAPGLARAVVDSGNGDSGRSQYGFGMNLDAGIEWWVGEQWGLGVALRLFYGTVQDDIAGTSDTVPITGKAAGLLFSATYQ